MAKRQNRYCKGCGKWIESVHSCPALSTTHDDLREAFANDVHETLEIDLFNEDGHVNAPKLDRLVQMVSRYIVLARKYL